MTGSSSKAWKQTLTSGTEPVIDLDGLLQARIDGFARKKHLVEAFAAVMLLLVVYLLLAIYFGVMSTVSRLREASERMLSGSVDQVITLETRDELGQVATSFNNIATRLRAEWAGAGGDARPGRRRRSCAWPRRPPRRPTAPRASSSPT